jgi:hypothetical protein
MAKVPPASIRRREVYRKKVRETRDPYRKFTHVCDWLFTEAQYRGRLKETQRAVLLLIDALLNEEPTQTPEPRRTHRR